MTTLLQCIFQQCASAFKILTVLGFLKLDILVTTFFAVYNFGNTSVMTIIIFFKMFKIWWRFYKCLKRLSKFSSFWDNCILIGCAEHSLLARENTSHSEAISWKTVWRFEILLRQTFSNWIYFRVTKTYDNTTAGIFQQCSAAFNISTVLRCTERRVFRHWGNSVFHTL